MTDRDALSKLPEFAWRGESYPVSSTKHSFRHETAEHRVSYGGLSLVEPLGPQNPTFSYDIPMDQGVARGPYSDLVKKVPLLARAMYDRTPGQLMDPLFGAWTVIPVEFAADTEATRRSGAACRVSYVWAPDLDQDVRRTGGVDTIADLASDAAALEQEVEIVARRYDPEARPPRINALDLISSITGQLSRNIEKVQAQVQRLTYQVEKTERFCVKLVKQTKDPDAFRLHRESRRIRASAVRTQKALNSLTRDITQVALAQTKSVLSVAFEFGMTVKELLSLNTELAASPVVEAGTVINVIRPAA